MSKWCGRLLLALTVAVPGCGGGAVLDAPPQTVAPAPPQETYVSPDQALLKEKVEGRSLSPREVVDLSNRLLTEGNSLLKEKDGLYRLEILLLKAVNTAGKEDKAIVLRNLGITHFYLRAFSRARQELGSSNEMNPRDARTHFYLARVYICQGDIFQSQGKKLAGEGKKRESENKLRQAKGQYKQADVQLGLARKLAPANSLYRQNLRQLPPPGPGK